MPSATTSASNELQITYPPGTTQDKLALARQSSDSILNEALAEIASTKTSSQRPSRAIGWRTGQSKPFAAMAALLDRVRAASHALQTSRETVRAGMAVTEWHAKAKKGRVSRAYELSVESFEKHDTDFTATLDAEHAEDACAFLHSMFGESIVAGTFKDTASQLLGEHIPHYNFDTWLEIASNVASLPSCVRSKLQSHQHQLRCTCGAWLQRKAASECYPGGTDSRVICDFTRQPITAAEVWHCPCSDSPLHPFGQDVCIESTRAYRKFNQGLRLEQRLSLHLKEMLPEEERLQAVERRAELCAELQPAAVLAFQSSQQDSLRVATVSEELQSRLAQLKSILSYEDWEAKYNRASAEVNTFIEHLKSRTTELSHDQVRFADDTDKQTQIAALEKEFNTAEQNARFDAVIEKVSETAFLAKHVCGPKQDRGCWEDPAYVEILNAVSNQTLQMAVLPQLPPMVRANIVSLHATTEWTPQGIKFKWALNMGASTLNLEHVVDLDVRDLAVAKFRHVFAEAQHNLRERIGSLQHCATANDLSCFSSGVQCTHDDMCVICQEGLEEAEDAVELHACGHRFHADCIEGWVLGCKQECPICKTPLQGTPQDTTKPGHEPVSPTILTAGTRVRFQNLQGRADLNGSLGTVIERHAESGRYRVRTGRFSAQGGDEVVAVRPVNLAAEV